MKRLKKITSALVSPFVLGFIVTLIVIYISHDYYNSLHLWMSPEDNSTSQLVQLIHEKTIDYRLKDRGQVPGSERVAILAIDERSIEEEGRWPWPRQKMAELVQKAIGSGAKSVSFDMIFSEKDANSSIPTLLRLRRDLKESQALDSKAQEHLNQLLISEIEKADSDQRFASAVASHSDQLVMGSYFESDIFTEPHVDLCLDALFSRSYENRYWVKEAIPLTVIDEPLKRLNFPPELKEHLGSYFMQLEVTAATRWFEKNPNKETDLLFALEELSSVIPPETYPGLSTLWLNNDKESLIELLDALSADLETDLGTEDGANLVLRRFSSAFTHKEQASLQATVRQAGLDYCKRFFNENDDLLRIESFQERWGADDETRSVYEAMAWQTIWPSIQSSYPHLKDKTLNEAVEFFRNEARPNKILNVLRWWINIPVLGDVTKHSGYFNAAQDTDGSIRRGYLFVRRANSYAPSLAFKTFLSDRNYKAIVHLDTENIGGDQGQTKVVKKLEIQDAENKHVMNIPADQAGRLMINYSGARAMFPYISASDVLSDKPTLTLMVQEKDESGTWRLNPAKEVNKQEFLKDKLLIAGATAIGVYDLRVTPFDENYPGVETHANILSNLLVEDERVRQVAMKGSTENDMKNASGFLFSHPEEERLMWLILLSLGVVLSGLLTYFGSIAGLAITAVAIVGIYSIDKYILFQSGVVTTIVFPVGLVSTLFVSLTFYKYFTEERKKRALKGTFEKYVSPAIVEEVLADPENIELGGKKMELTVMFSDVRGFTTISEKLDPRALSDLLNSYLTPMTGLVFKNKGTLDKYMGDAIMAFWGAPIHFPDHAKHACRCALEMIVKLKELQAEYRARGLPEIDIGIGLNTGEMSVGNMGSDTVRSYTVMGDAVNLGSRLEGINKQYGTRIIISEFTYEAIRDSFVTREVDWVRVKGKAKPVRIFELIAEGKVDAQTETLLRLFHEGFKHYHQRSFAQAISSFQEALKIRSDDAVSQMYIERCRNYVSEPPPENWDGVFTMTSK